MNKSLEQAEQLSKQLLSNESISKLAYYYWESEGYPDGDQLVETLHGWIKIRDCHWMRAELILESLAKDVMNFNKK